MDELTAPISVFLFVIIAGLLFFYNTARLRTKSYKSGKRKFNSINTNLLQLKDHISAESEQWPIYARPILFTEIDHAVQVEFAKAQHALTNASEIVPLIENSHEPETPEDFRIDYFFKVFKNLRTISIGKQFNNNINTLEGWVGNIESSIKSIRSDRYKVEKKRREVRRVVRELKNRNEQINKKLKTMDTWNAIESHKLSWVVKLASDCQLHAYEKINSQPDEENGYLEHALADVFVEVGNFALDCIELFIESQNISRRYELDLFTNLFDQSINFLQSIIEMDIDWNGWRRLRKVKSHTDQLPEIKHETARSLRVFKHKQQVLEKLIKSINDINLSSEIEYVYNLESDCTYYWFSYEERRNDWEQVLGSPPRFPSTELNRLQTLLLTEILPAISVDMFIKQGKISKLIKDISQTLYWYECIKNLINKLDTEIRFHKDAQKTVDSLLSSQGKATTIITQLRVTLVDTSPDFTDEGEKLVNEHQIYSERARKVRGANFPELETSLVQFVTQAESLVGKHNLEIAKLTKEFQSLSQNIKETIIVLNNFINHKPRFNPQTLRVLITAHKTAQAIMKYQFSYKYSWLREMTNEMNAWIEKINPFIEQSRDQIISFQMGKKQIEQQLRKVKNEIQIQRVYIERMNIERMWSWYKNEIISIIGNAERLIDIEIDEWTNLEEREWAEFTIYKVIAISEEVVKSSEKILDNLNQQIRKIRQSQNDLNRKIEDIDDFRTKNSKKLSPEDQSEINELINLARQAQHYDTVEKYLQHALSLALKRANLQERNNIKHIINIHSAGGPVFMGSVDNRYGKITGKRS